MKISFEKNFRTDNRNRDNFLARLFGIFSEEVVHAWCNCPAAPYENLGRPSIYLPEKKHPYTIDFTLRHKATNQIFIAEMKCWTAFQNYRYLKLINSSDLEKAAKDDGGFKRLFPVITKLAKEPRSLEVKINKSLQHIDGVILIWGSVAENGREEVIQKYGFADILSVEIMLNDLEEWRSEQWGDYVNERQKWCNELFNYLKREEH